MVRFEAQYKDFNGKLNDLDLSIKAVFEKDERISYFIANGYNVTELVKVRRALSNRERQLTALFHHSKDGFIFNVLPNGLDKNLDSDLKALMNDSIRYLAVVETNAALKQILGIPEDEDKTKMTFYELLKLKGSEYRKCVDEVLEHGEYKFEHRIKNHSEALKILEVSLSAIMSESMYYGFFAVVRDLTVQKTYEEELEFYANNDPLTGLRNRRYYFNKLDRIFNGVVPASFICMFDIDHFKKINDTYGHDMGDLVLVKFSDFARNHFKSLTEVCRYGGEEFLVFVPIEKDSEIQEYLEAFRIGVSQIDFETTEGVHFNITISIGSALCEQNTPLKLLISNADKALYHSKASGRNKVTFYHDL